jgi:hypothetical protein
VSAHEGTADPLASPLVAPEDYLPSIGKKIKPFGIAAFLLKRQVERRNLDRRAKTHRG